jgi:hypothetical protein
MANEHVLVYETHQAIPFTCSNTAGIEKGTACKLTDPMTASAHAAANDIIAGIAKTEKINADGKTKISIYRGGIFKATASGNITAGDPLVLSNAAALNKLETAATNVETIVGIALETCTDGETFLYELRPTTMQLA